MTVLVTGARGDVGAAVLAGLLAAGEPVRASSRAPRPGEFPDTHRGAAYPVLGAGPVTVREQVAAIAAALGEPVRLEEVDVDTYRAQLLTQLPGPIVERVLQDRGSVPQLPAELATDAVPEILGRPALTFAEWARDHAADFR